MKKLQKISLIILFLTLSQSTIYSWQVFDRVIAVVNNIPIIESEVLIKFKQLQKMKKISRRKHNYEKSRILDQFIEDSLVLETAKEEAIVISDSVILDYMEKIMHEYFRRSIPDDAERESLIGKLSSRLKAHVKGQELKSKNKTDAQLINFISFLEKKQKTDIITLYNDLRKQMRKEQVIKYAVGVTPPSKEESLAWYRKNKAKLGYEVRVKHILIRPKAKSIKAEREANKLITTIRKRILKGESFEKLARKYSQDRATARKGGDTGWNIIQELEPTFAVHVHQMRRPGQISGVVKSSYGYHVIKYLGRRSIPYEKAEGLIMNVLYQNNLQIQFKKWVQSRKKESEIKIFMQNYIKG